VQSAIEGNVFTICHRQSSGSRLPRPHDNRQGRTFSSADAGEW
jgi:hypothetical protein